MADAVGQQAFQLIATGDTVSPPRAAALNARSRAIVEALVKGNAAPLFAALGPGGADSADVASQERQLLESRRQRFGAFQSIDVLGTVTNAEGDMQTTVRLNFSGGGATNLYAWDPTGRIVDIGARPYQSVELFSAGNGEFRSVDARGGTGARLTFANGKLTAVSPRGPLAIARAMP